MAEHREAVVFPNRDGLNLFGILRRPEDIQERPIGIIFLSPGVKSRVAPHRLYVKMTEALLEQGYPVLRFDFFGLGDSEGELLERELTDLYAKVQDGRYLQDTLCAMDWMQHRLGLQKFVLAGLCGGALTALFAAEKDIRVCGVLGLGLPVALDGRATDASKYMTQGQLNDVGGTYLSKVLKPGAWLRVLTLKTDFRMLWRALLQRLLGRRTVHAIGSAGSLESNLNPLLPSAFFGFLARGGRLLLIFSGADRLAWEFEEKFSQPNAERIERVSTRYEIHTIPSANHILSDPAWRQQMQSLVHGWLARSF